MENMKLTLVFCTSLFVAEDLFSACYMKVFPSISSSSAMLRREYSLYIYIKRHKYSS